MSSKPTVLIIGTCDTKLEEILFLRDQISAQGTCHTKVLNWSYATKPSPDMEKLTGEIIAPMQEAGSSWKDLPRGEYTEKVIETCLPLVKDMITKQKIQGIISAGGSSASAVATAIMRKVCPIGMPKFMVSTMASGDVKHYIEETDITMMYSVLDIAGLNSILRRILSNAAAAISAMTLSYGKSLLEEAEAGKRQESGRRVAISMFGNTTPCVDAIRKILTSAPHDVSAHEIYVFHATGSGGRAMERLISEGQIDAVIDLTTTEIPDELFGGVLSAGPHRLEAAPKRGIPTVVSVGACDMVNFGPQDTVPEKYKDRHLLEHNPAVTLMRTTKEENKKIGEFIASQLRTHAKDPSLIRVLLPEGGLSLVDARDKPFYDPEADEELFKAIGENLEDTQIQVEKYPENINDEDFAVQVTRVLLELMGVDIRKLRLSNARRRKWSFDHGASVMGPRRTSTTEVPSTNYS